ncbi:MAG: hypothetical protein JSW61_00410 [Candidatus Thorarchaeota archaeon]|nr:MAG: hypothetical protein JSW61_00410 [Candidatus Thorarchaeota archaeon]
MVQYDHSVFQVFANAQLKELVYGVISSEELQCLKDDKPGIPTPSGKKVVAYVENTHIIPTGQFKEGGSSQ